MELHRGITRLRAGRAEPSTALKPEAEAAAPFCVPISADDDDLDSFTTLSSASAAEDQNERLRLFEEMPGLLGWARAHERRRSQCVTAALHVGSRQLQDYRVAVSAGLTGLDIVTEYLWISWLAIGRCAASRLECRNKPKSCSFRLHGQIV